jgi:N-acetylmuramic acid 6-phosphate etherase
MNDDLPYTEHRHPGSTDLDVMPVRQLVELLADEQHVAVKAVTSQSAALGEAVDAIAGRLSGGGRLHYVGAGTSGRLAILDAAEMPPTFGTPADLVQAHIAGGDAALTRAVEGAEDDAEAGAAAMEGVGGNDAVIAISASGGAAFAIAAIERARAAGAYTVALVNVPGSALARAAELAIVLSTGPEPLTGSTRLKAGTAQKIALNAVSTAVMVRLGKVYENLMVDVVAGNRKLRDRAIRLVRTIARVDAARAKDLLQRAGGRVKIAVVMQTRNVGVPEAEALLERHAGKLRSLL